MCGICGVAGNRQKVDLETLTAMGDALTHRGPDGYGHMVSPDQHVGLCHRRLAIIDLSERGRQPMTDGSGDYHITFNGEIYNFMELKAELEQKGHTFNSRSDTEVILEAYVEWGPGCIRKLNGMFTFCIYDSVRHDLILARDRAGEKPLYYSHRPGEFRFASELKALMSDRDFPRRLDTEAANFFFAYGYVPGDRCILKGVRKLPPGQWLRYRILEDKIEHNAYWHLPAQKDSCRTQGDEVELVTELEALLTDAVGRQLLSDVPVGILLSGGLDSSLVTALAARNASKPIKTYTITFPGFGDFDEGPHARRVAEFFSTDHTELPVGPASLDLLPKLAAQYDEPISDSSMIPTYLVSTLVRQEATVALGGDGGDELFGGYSTYSNIQKLGRFKWRWARRRLAGLANALLPLGFPGRNHLLENADGLSHYLVHPAYFGRSLRQQLLAPIITDAAFDWDAPERFKEALLESNLSPLQQATRLDFQTYLPDNVLCKVDRASMLASLEVRAPWLDYRIIDFAFASTPDHLRATASTRKILPKKLGKRILPPAFDMKRKQGFSLPLQDWFLGGLDQYFEEVLVSGEARAFDGGTISRLLRGQRRGYSNNGRLFALAVFELWRRHYKISF